MHRLALKTGIFLFTVFSIGDILFGDRAELWEHGTFMILTLITYLLYIMRETIEEQEEDMFKRAGFADL